LKAGIELVRFRRRQAADKDGFRARLRYEGQVLDTTAGPVDHCNDLCASRQLVGCEAQTFAVGRSDDFEDALSQFATDPHN
jgi:hypothetical protein